MTYLCKRHVTARLRPLPFQGPWKRLRRGFEVVSKEHPRVPEANTQACSTHREGLGRSLEGAWKGLRRDFDGLKQPVASAARGTEGEAIQAR